MAPAVVTVGTLVYAYQAIDAFGPLDVLNSGSSGFAHALGVFGPVNETARARAPEFLFHHVGLSRDPVPMLTAGLTLTPTCTVDDAPDFDILLVPGPNPADFTLDPRHAEFIRKHIATGRLLWTNCTGACIAAMAGVLDGKRVTVNHVEYEWARNQFPKVNWTRETKWVVDGNIWTAAGAVAGMDMTAHWMKENFGEEVMVLATKGLDFEPRDINGVLNVIAQRYDTDGKQIASWDLMVESLARKNT